MKKLVSLLSLSLMIGSVTLFAQTPMHKDSMMNAKNKMNKDSMMSTKNNMHRDSMMSSNNNMHRDSMMSSKNNMHQDSMMSSKNTMREGDTMSISNMQNDNKLRSDNTNSDGNMAASANNIPNKNGKMMTPDVSNWPEASKMAVDEITAKYGKPDGVTEDELIWIKKGVWKKICVNKLESKHSFPIEHTDMMQTTISYNVPEDKMDDLGKFDGSVTFDRTQGTMSARCDKEANNILALNLANDIITNKKTVAEARKAYGDIIKVKMKGGNPTYMVKLTFAAKSNTEDPDKNTTGLTKEDVSKAVAQNSKN